MEKAVHSKEVAPGGLIDTLSKELAKHDKVETERLLARSKIEAEIAQKVDQTEESWKTAGTALRESLKKTESAEQLEEVKQAVADKVKK